MFRNIFEKESLPREWRRAKYVVPVFKKDSRDNALSHRSVSLKRRACEILKKDNQRANG